MKYKSIINILTLLVYFFIAFLFYSCDSNPINEPAKPSPSIKLLTPNGSEVYSNVDTIYISWESAIITSVDILISYDNAANWDTIATGFQSSSKSYYYSKPDTGSYYCLIKISASENSLISDVSDSTFIIINVTEAKKYYQLEIGNVWVYDDAYVDLGGGIIHELEREEVSGEVFTNNKKYFEINVTRDNSNYYKYYRVSKYGDLLDMSGSTVFHMTVPHGEHQISEAIVFERGSRSKTILNENYLTEWQNEIYGGGFGTQNYIEFARGLGKSKTAGGSFEYPSWTELKGAVINNIVIGDTSYYGN